LFKLHWKDGRITIG